jgi:phage-related protein
MNFLGLTATLGLDKKDYDKGLNEAESSASSFGSKLKTGLKVAAGVTTAAIGATTAATIAGAKAFISSAKDVAAYGDSIDKNSQKMGISAKAYQEWDFILQHAGSSIEGMKTSMLKLTKAAEEGNDAFKELGISQEDLANMSQEQIFEATIKGLQGVEDAGKRTVLANKLLGKGAVELGALLNQTAQDTEAMKQQVHDLGGVLSDDAVKASAGFQDSLKNMSTALSGLKNNMMSDFLPSLSTTMDGLSAVFSGVDVEGGLAQIEQGVQTLANNLIAKAPQIFSIGGSIIQALATSIGSNLPTLLQAAVPVAGQLVNTIIGLAPTLINSLFTLINSVLDWLVNGGGLTTLINGVISLITTLATSLANNISTIIPMIVSAIMQVFTALTNPDVILSLTQAAITLVQELTNGIISAIPIILEQLPVIIENICTSLLEGLPLLLEAGISLFMSLVDALPTIIEALMENLPKIIETIIDTVLKALPLLLDAAIKLFMALIQALPKIIVALVKELPKIITTIITTLLNNLPALIKGAIELFMGIIKAIPQIIIEFGKQMPTIIKAIIEGLMEGLSQIGKVGIELMKGLLEGLKNGLKKIGEGIKKIGEGIVGTFKKIFKISSPSKLFRDVIGRNLALGIGEGFEDEMTNTISDMVGLAEGAAEQVASAMTIGDLEMSTNASKTSSFASGDMSTGKTGNSIYLGPFTFNIVAPEGQDIRELAKEVSREIQNLIDDKGKAYA